MKEVSRVRGVSGSGSGPPGAGLATRRGTLDWLELETEKSDGAGDGLRFEQMRTLLAGPGGYVVHPEP